MSNNIVEETAPTPLERVEHQSLAEALAAFQAEVPIFKKSQEAKMGAYSYWYADLGEILSTIYPVLAKHGLSWSAKPGRDEHGDLVLRYVLRHISDESDHGEMPLGVPKNCKPQELGSAITYMRRYALTAQLNLATEKDDDAQAAQEASRQPPRHQPQAAPAEKTERAASAKQRSMVYGRAKELAASTLANAILEATGSERRDWVSEDAALAWVNRNMERLPARFVDPLLSVVQRETETLHASSATADVEAEFVEPEPTIPFEMGETS